MSDNRFYITTPIYYPSDKLHIGHLLHRGHRRHRPLSASAGL